MLTASSLSRPRIILWKRGDFEDGKFGLILINDFKVHQIKQNGNPCPERYPLFHFFIKVTQNTIIYFENHCAFFFFLFTFMINMRKRFSVIMDTVNISSFLLSLCITIHNCSVSANTEPRMRETKNPVFVPNINKTFLIGLKKICIIH